jgi:hypothetical protein
MSASCGPCAMSLAWPFLERRIYDGAVSSAS